MALLHRGQGLKNRYRHRGNFRPLLQRSLRLPELIGLLQNLGQVDVGFRAGGVEFNCLAERPNRPFAESQVGQRHAQAQLECCMALGVFCLRGHRHQPFEYLDLAVVLLKSSMELCSHIPQDRSGLGIAGNASIQCGSGQLFVAVGRGAAGKGADGDHVVRRIGNRLFHGDQLTADVTALVVKSSENPLPWTCPGRVAAGALKDPDERGQVNGHRWGSPGPGHRHRIVLFPALGEQHVELLRQVRREVCLYLFDKNSVDLRGNRRKVAFRL